MDNVVQLHINREIFCDLCGQSIMTAYDPGNPIIINCPRCNHLIAIDFKKREELDKLNKVIGGEK